MFILSYIIPLCSLNYQRGFMNKIKFFKSLFLKHTVRQNTAVASYTCLLNVNASSIYSLLNIFSSKRVLIQSLEMTSLI